MLNETVAFSQIPAEHQRAFVGSSAKRTVLAAGLELYKFTHAEVMPQRADSCLTPWWAAVGGFSDYDDLGLDGHIAAATATGMRMVDYARENFAVLQGWNALGIPELGMARVLRVLLAVPAYGFVGTVQRQMECAVYDAKKQNVLGHTKSPARQATMRPGGAIQVYIPNLKSEHVRTIGTHLIA